MFRKSALAMAMLGAFASTNVVALGLGEIELKSALNQPLDAEVELLSPSSAELDELKVEVASARAFAAAGLDRPLFLNKLKFNVSRNADGRPVIHITSRDVVREPFLDFLLEMSWSKGRLVREYTVLVDPPVTMPAPAPVTRAPARASAPTVAAAPAPARQVTHTAQLPPVSKSPGEYGPTKRNDTLWSIAEQVRPDTGVSVEQTMLGLLRANPEAFIDNNINNLKAGYVLRVPDRAALTSVSRREALRETRAQYRAWRAAQTPEASPSGAPADSAAMAADSGAGDASLELVAPESGSETGGVQGAEGLEAVEQELMMANEALEAQRRQSEEMSGRLSVLEEQIANMQRLIQLKDNELARLQAQAAGAEPAPTEALASLPESAESADASGEMPMEETAAEPGGSGAQAAAGEPAAEMPVAEEAAAPQDMPAEDAGTEVAGSVVTGAGPLEETAPGAETAMAAADDPAGQSAEPAPEPAAEQAPPEPVTATAPGFIDRLLANPLYLGAGAAVLLLLAFFGLRRKRSVETEFQESILQAAQAGTEGSDSEIVASQPESTQTKGAHSSLLSEFAVSDMGSIRNDGEADPLAEADVYLAYGRYQQAEDLIKDALEKDSEREDLNLKLLEVFMAARNVAAFDEHAQMLLGRLENSDHPMWVKIAEMGQELDPDNPLYRDGEMPPAVDDAAGYAGDEQDDGLDDMSAESASSGDEGLEFDVDLSYPGEAGDEGKLSGDSGPAPEDARADLDFDMDSVEPDAVSHQDEALEFDVDNFDIDAAAGVEEEPEGDGQLTDLDEVSTKLDLARAYIDMGDPDGARSILEEVMEEGSDEHKNEARDILSQIS